jgi:methionyl-tRNA formyltransferase
MMNSVMTPVRTLFFGTSEVALPSLEALAQDQAFAIVGIVTQPDRPAGRKQTLEASPVKELALKLGLPVLQFEQVKEPSVIQSLKDLNPTLGVVVSFGQIIPQALLDLFPLGVINVHPSLLPKYRGASPMAAAIAAGETMTGVSIMKMDALMDHGPVYHRIESPVLPTDTTPILSSRLSKEGASLLLKTLHELIENPRLPSEEQDHAKASIVRRYRKEDGLLDWQRPAAFLERLVRAFVPWPGTYTTIDEKRLKILESAVGPTTELEPETRFITPDGQPAVACGDGKSLILTLVQPEGGKAMDGTTFLRGRPNW